MQSELPPPVVSKSCCMCAIVEPSPMNKNDGCYVIPQIDSIRIHEGCQFKDWVKGFHE